MTIHRAFVRAAGTVTLAALVLAGCHHRPAQGLSERTRDGRLSPLLSNFGDYRRAVSTKSPDAQRFFSQGLLLVYAFNHFEALRSFQEAARHDPSCGMLYWGQALALAPNINDSAIGPDREQEGYTAIRQAVQNKGGLSEVETALIDALAARFTADAKPDRAKLNQAYAEAMAKVFQRFPDDPDVATLYADAVMNTSPWDYYTKDGKPKPAIAKAIAALEHAMKASPDHPGAHHIYIHAVEASADPDRAVPSADKVGRLVPGAGHLVHMPSHIYIRVGRYADASEANVRAIAADEDYITQCRAQGIYPAAYYPHNIHFLFATLSMEGRSKDTLEAARKVATRHTHDDLKDPTFGFPHLLRSIPYFAMIRFAQWDSLLAEPEPAKEFPFVRAMWHFARGTALAAKGDLRAGEAQLAALRGLAREPSLAKMTIFDVNSLDKLAGIAERMLTGDLAGRKGRVAEAVRALRAAIELEDGLKYSEPPDWPLPTRHILGAVLLDAGRAAEAEQVYREDLKRHRNNGWALKGLERSLAAQGRKREAAEVAKRFQKSWERADLQISSSRL